MELTKHYPCAYPLSLLCKNSLLNEHKAICCDYYHQWLHIKYNGLNDLYYNILKSKNEFWVKSKNVLWYFTLCTSQMLPFYPFNSRMSFLQEKLNRPTGALVILMVSLIIWLVKRKKMNWNCQTETYPNLNVR